jgi:hypothetical protein
MNAYQQITEILKNAVAEGYALGEIIPDIKAIQLEPCTGIYSFADNREIYARSTRAHAFIAFLTSQFVTEYGFHTVSSILGKQISMNTVKSSDGDMFYEYAKAGLGTNIFFGQAIDNCVRVDEDDIIIYTGCDWIRRSELRDD